MDKRTIIHGGVLGMETGPLRADLVIDGDRISAITLDASDYEADEWIDATGKFVVPAGVDVHTHFKEPSDPLTEGFYTGSLGAIAGGIGTVVEMPQATPVSSEGAHIKEKIRVGTAESIVDFALWGAAINQDLDKIDEMIDAGVVGIKSFMAGSSPGFPAATDGTLLAVFDHLALTGIPYGLHAENDQLLQAGIARMQAAGRKDPRAHAESRPPIVETEAINRAIFFAEQTGGQAYICHVSTIGGFELIRRAQDRGVNVYGETCPQYLVLDEDDLVALGPFARCAPAIRDREQVEGLWDFVADGTVDVISSDHCGYTIESKEAGLDDIWQEPLGLSGVQTMYPSIFDEMLNKRGLEISDFVRLTAANPARIFSLYPRKGSLNLGADADIAIYDPDDLWTVTGDDMLHRNKWTPMEGREIQGRVVRTIIRGATVYTFDKEPKVFGERGSGRFLPRDSGLAID
ncbi:MAG TPA: amidohydrolase family protein [Nitrolancea sp.]|jgi:allantoinase|nr:amidohydrolase family protein [Nitrolancea sp.]